MATGAVLATPPGSLVPQHSAVPGLDGLRLRIFDQIEPGFGIVAVTGDDAGSHMLHQGEVAVYDESWRDRLGSVDNPLEPGLYCLERQRAPGHMPNHMIAERFAANDPVRMRCERRVATVFRHPRRPDFWAYRDLRSRLHHGTLLTARNEGPIYEWGMLDMILGPIVGIYRPQMGGLN